MAATLFNVLGVSEEEIVEMINRKSKFYVSYSISKKSGKPRHIDAPIGNLKTWQKQILKNILNKFSASQIAHGFVKGRSPLTNAERHVGAKILIKVDIANFFNNISQQQVFDALKTFLNKYYPIITLTNNNLDLLYLSELLTYKRRIPQGAPTSPCLTNLICLGMDRDLIKLSNKYNCVITRYADDITISSNQDIPINNILSSINHILKKFNFTMRWAKTKVCTKAHCMQVTGIVVNEKINIKRSQYRNLRAQLHQLSKNKIKITKNDFEILRGKVEWIRTLNQNKAFSLTEQLSKMTFQTT